GWPRIHGLAGSPHTEAQHACRIARGGSGQPRSGCARQVRRTVHTDPEGGCDAGMARARGLHDRRGTRMSWVTVAAAAAAVAAGRMIILVDDADRENEGDLMLAAACATPEAINTLAREACGLICAPVDHVVADRLDLPPMVPPERNMARHGTAFTLSVEA